METQLRNSLKGNASLRFQVFLGLSLLLRMRMNAFIINALLHFFSLRKDALKEVT